VPRAAFQRLGHAPELPHPRIAQRFSPDAVLELRATVLNDLPLRAHDLSFVRRETL